MLAKIAAIPLAAAAFAQAAYVVVSVGNDGATGATVFTPRVIRAALGDVVSFTFQPNAVGGTGNHSIVQTSAARPCTPLQRGFVSPLAQTPGASFNIVIYDDSVPIYFACGSTNGDREDDHCQRGEVGVINPLPGDMDTTDIFDAASLVAEAQLAPHDGAMTSIPPGGSGYGSGIAAYVQGYFNPQERYSLPPNIYPSSGSRPTYDGPYSPWIPTPTSVSGSSTPSSGVHLNPGAIAGIAIGSVLVALLAILAIWRAVSVKKRKEKTGVFAKRVSMVLDVPASPKEISDVDAAMRERSLGEKVMNVQPKLEV